MGGFDAGWLALREPADREARAERLIRLAADDLGRSAAPSVCDLGAGTGAAVRAFAAVFPPSTRWTLVDNDETLLSEARRAAPGVATRAADLGATPAPWPEDCTLVTATALFDLAAPAWIERFVSGLSAAGLPLLACLTYDGTTLVDPPHPADEQMLAAFNRHQRTDKGLGGPAAGPDAPAVLVRRLEMAGYDVDTAPSPWVLDREAHGELMLRTLDGMAEAAAETSDVAVDETKRWLGDRKLGLVRLTVGHQDLYARPTASPT